MPPRRARSRDSSVLAVGVLTSAALHWLVLSLPLNVPSSVPARPNYPTARADSDELRLITITTADPSSSGLQPVAGTTATGNPASTVNTIAPSDAPDDDESFRRATAPTVAERLRVSPLPALIELPRSATVEAAVRLRGEVAAFNDSITEVQNRGALPSWTVAESGGGRWGISPGKIHLGRHTVSPCEDFALLRITVMLDPFTCQFRMPDAQRRELRSRIDLHREIQLRAGLSEADAQFRRRIDAMNARAAVARDTIPR